ncbi:serine/threonine protein kinase [Saccharomycopsis crataegensis]|uniref:non-specific serine/threonine protein kinase n=1 Tax=Saccharomycopsis crataegensis TaxID=43959 RepID=A0AAV5QDC5_9ASCO|nr:serine/threonine protein kinase [Saccharomycopsis crataegensis]
MPEVATRTKRSSTISKIGRIFGVHESKTQQPSESSTHVSMVDTSPSETTVGTSFTNSRTPSLKNKSFKEGSTLSSLNTSRLNSINTSSASLNKLPEPPSYLVNEADNRALMKKLNNLKISNDEKLRSSSNPKRNFSNSAVAITIDEELPDAAPITFSSLTSTVSNPNISHSNLVIKNTRKSRSRSVSKNTLHSKENVQEFVDNSTTSKANNPPSRRATSRPPRPAKTPRSKSNSETSLKDKGNSASNHAATIATTTTTTTTTKKDSGNQNKSSSSLHKSSAASNNNNNIKDKYCGRLKIYEDGTHEHLLRNAKRQEKLSTMIKNFLGAKKLRDESVSAVSNILPNIMPDGNVPPSLMSNLMNIVKQNENGKIELVLENELKIAGSNGGTPFPQTIEIQETLIDPRSFAEKYGSCQEVIGRGTFGVVKISHKKVSENKENLYAVKEFRCRAHESEKEYSQRLAREFCISSSLKNIHIIQTLDLLQDAKGDYCEVMEFCTGGDLYSLIVTSGKLEYIEADCFFKQLVRGVSYMHTMGVAHRDIKPENILLTADGNLKITDFGTSECFSFAWESTIHLFEGIIGSAPYIAPELYSNKKYDLRPADVWACGVVYMAMRTGRQLWRSANFAEDEFYQEYLKGRKDANGYFPIESLKRARCRNVIYSILDPVPGRRITAKQILNSEWGREVKCCEAGEYGTKTDNVMIDDKQTKPQPQTKSQSQAKKQQSASPSLLSIHSPAIANK